MRVGLVLLLLCLSLQSFGAVILFDRTQVAGNVPFDNSTNGFTATDVHAAIEEAKATAVGRPRFALTLMNNGTLTNGQNITFSELMPDTPIILPVACTFREITFQNSNTGREASFALKARTPPGAFTTFYTWNLSNVQTAYATGFSQVFAAGDEIQITFTDTGDNPSDVAMVLFFNIN